MQVTVALPDYECNHRRVNKTQPVDFNGKVHISYHTGDNGNTNAEYGYDDEAKPSVINRRNRPRLRRG